MSHAGSQRHPSINSQARCPRCGYDQRGVIETWKESCPLSGTCSECGLEFSWCDVLVPEKFEPRWCIEFEPKWWRLWWAAAKTLWRSLWPWGFWSRLKMSDPIRWGRLSVYLLMLVLPALLMYVVAQGSLATYVRSQIQSQFTMQATMRPQQIANLQNLTTQYQRMVPSGDSARDQMLQTSITNINAEIARLTALGTTVETIDRSWLATTWEAIASPLARTSSANIIDGNGVRRWPYPPPSSLLRSFLQTGAWGTRSLRSELMFMLAWLAWGVAITAMLPLSFALLPMSMRKAKVRWSHIGRVTIYSAWIPLACIWLSALLLGPAYFFDYEQVFAAGFLAVRYVPWLAVALWWVAATARYLKIPHAWPTIAALTLMCLLGLLGLTSLVDDQLAWEMLDLFDVLIR